jgi:hypothetical protein
MVVQVQPAVQGSRALGVGLVGTDLGPLGYQGPGESLGLAVGLGPVRAGEALDRTQLGHHGLDLAAVAVGEGVVSQHPLDGDVVGGEEAAGPAQESCAGGATLVGQDLGIGQPGVVIDGGMDLVIARAVVPIPAAMLARVAAMDAVAAAVTQPPELLDVHVEQLAGWARS